MAVVLLAQHPAVLAGHANRVLALLRESRVINDPPAAQAEVHLRHDPLAHTAKQFLIRPVGLGHEMMQRLMPRAGVQRINPRRHRLHTLARQGQHQPRAVALETSVAVQVPEA